MTQILIAFPAGSMSEKIRVLLLHAGYQQVTVVSGGGEALRSMGELNSGILICPVKLKDMDYHALLEDMPPLWRLILIDSTKNIASRREDDVMAVGLPTSGGNIVDTIMTVAGELDAAVRQEAKRKKSQPRKRTAAEQKVIDDAKALIMNRNHMTEEEAFRHIQKSSMDMGRSMVETAEMILMFG